MTPFRTLPNARRLTLADLAVPGCLVGREAELVPTTLTVEDGRIDDGPAGEVVEMGGAIAFPAFVDMHTHLDKGHIWKRCPNPDGTFAGAIEAVGRDRAANWTAEDVRTRMTFGLECAFAHGTRAIRTHLDSIPPQDAISWPVFRELRADWAGRIDLQGVCLVGIGEVEADGPFHETADLVAASGGVLGAVAYPVADLDARLDTIFRLAAERGLALDFHADENGDPESHCLRAIAEARLRHRFDAPVTVGHCCSLAVQPETEADRTMDLVAEAGLSVVSLPLCNLYLQDREPGRTPRWRGVTLVHEMAARGIAVSFASDNTRDPFYAYGDLDMLEVMREATRIAHLDHAGTAWPLAFTATPAAACGFEAPSLAPGAPADLVICAARNWTELLARPQADRLVIRGGRAIERALPDFAGLDSLMESR